MGENLGDLCRHLPMVCLLLFHMAVNYVTTQSNALAFGEIEKINWKHIIKLHRNMIFQRAGYYSKPAYENQIKSFFFPYFYFFHLEQSWEYSCQRFNRYFGILLCQSSKYHQPLRSVINMRSFAKLDIKNFTRSYNKTNEHQTQKIHRLSY